MSQLTKGEPPCLGCPPVNSAGCSCHMVLLDMRVRVGVAGTKEVHPRCVQWPSAVELLCISHSCFSLQALLCPVSSWPANRSLSSCHSQVACFAHLQRWFADQQQHELSYVAKRTMMELGLAFAGYCFVSPVSVGVGVWGRHEDGVCGAEEAAGPRGPHCLP